MEPTNTLPRFRSCCRRHRSPRGRALVFPPSRPQLIFALPAHAHERAAASQVPKTGAYALVVLSNGVQVLSRPPFALAQTSAVRRRCTAWDSEHTPPERKLSEVADQIRLSVHRCCVNAVRVDFRPVPYVRKLILSIPSLGPVTCIDARKDTRNRTRTRTGIAAQHLMGMLIVQLKDTYLVNIVPRNCQSGARVIIYIIM